MLRVLKNKKYVGVEFEENGKVYSYFSLIDVALNDVVVVETKFGLRIAKVVSLTLSKEAKERATAHILDIVDLSICNMIQTKKELTKAIEERAEKVLKNLKYEFLAEYDDELASLIRKLQQLS